MGINKQIFRSLSNWFKKILKLICSCKAMIKIVKNKVKIQK